MHADERAVRETHATWIAAVNAGDLERLLTMLADDVLMIGPGQSPMGRDGFAANFSDACERLRFHCTSEPASVVVAGDVAYTLSRDALTVAPRAGGDEARLAGDRLTVYRRHADGRWLLARDAHTLGVVAS